jgi:predicted Ser/Thr protein kinase
LSSDPEDSREGSSASPKAGSIPERFGKYFILRELGRGGMGVIYEAIDQDLNRKVALKLMLSAPGAAGSQGGEEEGRLIREAQLAAKLKHPHIVTIYESGVLDGQRFIAMELVEGKPFSAWWGEPAFTIARQVEIVRDVALAVHYAHEQGVLHRDLKPQNILVNGRGGMAITDFGLAKGLGPNTALTLTASGNVVGTPAYMSPEQAQGRKDVDARTDVYSMGVMLYEILAGRPPFQGESAVDLLLKAVKDPVLPPSNFRAGTDKTIEKICLKALCRDREDRYATAEALASDLTRWLGGEKVRVVVPKKKNLRPWLYAAAAVVLVALVALAFRPWAPSVPELLAKADHLMEAGKADEALALYTLAESRERNNAAAKTGREKALAKLKERAEPPPIAPPSEESWKKAVDLLPSVEVDFDALSGAWTRKDGAILVESGAPARLEIPYRPPEEYDVRLTFTRHAGEYCVSLLLSRRGTSFIWVMEPTGRFGFERVYGQDFLRNPTSVPNGPVLEPGRPHTAVVQVRRDGLRAFIDGRLIREWKTDYSDLTMNPGWALRDPQALGVGVWQSATTFHRLEILEVSGKGLSTRSPGSNPNRK